MRQSAAMKVDPLPEDLVIHLTNLCPLSDHEARRVVREIHAYYTESTESFVIRRHGELQRLGLANRAIYQQIIVELDHRRFPAPVLSQRQIRRLIYG